MEVSILNIAIIIVVILISMTFHEAMHAFVGFWLGDKTAKLQGRLTLNPIKHIDPFLTLVLPIVLAIAGLPIFGGAKPVPFNPNNIKWGEWGAALIAVVGPLTNLFIAFILFGIYALISPYNTGLLSDILVLGVQVNLGFFVFNMIPIPPLDGSRVLYALAPEFVRRSMEAIERFGIIFIFLIVILAGSLIGPFMLAIMNFFIKVFSFIFGI